jgi:hypothetical protein
MSNINKENLNKILDIPDLDMSYLSSNLLNDSHIDCFNMYVKDYSNDALKKE